MVQVDGVATWLNVVLTPPPSSGTPWESQAKQGRDRVGIVEGSCGYRARGVSIRGKFVLSRNLGYKMKGRHVPAAVHHGRARQSSWTGRCRDCRRVLWVACPMGLVFGDNLCYRETWGTRRRGTPRG